MNVARSVLQVHLLVLLYPLATISTSKAEQRIGAVAVELQHGAISCQFKTSAFNHPELGKLWFLFKGENKLATAEQYCGANKKATAAAVAFVFQKMK